MVVIPVFFRGREIIRMSLSLAFPQASMLKEAQFDTQDPRLCAHPVTVRTLIVARRAEGGDRRRPKCTLHCQSC